MNWRSFESLRWIIGYPYSSTLKMTMNSLSERFSRECRGREVNFALASAYTASRTSRRHKVSGISANTGIPENTDDAENIIPQRHSGFSLQSMNIQISS